MVSGFRADAEILFTRQAMRQRIFKPAFQLLTGREVDFVDPSAYPSGEPEIVIVQRARFYLR